MPLQLDRAELIAVLVESVTYGVAVNSIIRTLRAMFLLEKDSRRRVHPLTKVFRFAPYVMLFIATLHLFTDWYRNIHALTGFPARQDAIIFLADVRHWSYALKDISYGTSSQFGDMLLLLRAYIVWDRKLIPVLFPTACFIGSLISGGLVAFYEIKGYALFNPPLSSAVISILTCFTLNNVSSTFLIILRVWKVRGGSWGKHFGLSTFPIMKILIETGLIYCLATLATLILFLSKVTGQIIVLNSIASLIPILFCSILLQAVDRSASNRGNVSTSYVPDLSVDTRKQDRQNSRLNGLNGRGGNIPSVENGVQVEISRFIQMTPVKSANKEHSDGDHASASVVDGDVPDVYEFDPHKSSEYTI